MSQPDLWIFIKRVYNGALTIENGEIAAVLSGIV
jgi:hypothetical protein